MTAGTTYTSAVAHAAADVKQFPYPIDHPLGKDRVTWKAHHPDHYAPPLIPGGRPYCYPCGMRVGRKGCSTFLGADGRLNEDQREREQRSATGHVRARM